MRTRFLSALVAPFVLGALALPVTAQVRLGPFAHAPERGFPMVPMETFGELGVRYAPDPAQVAALDGLEDVRLVGVLVPTPTGLESVDLDLRRIDPVAEGAVLLVDGQVAGGAEEIRGDVSLWTGAVRGEPGSDVYLAFTDTGSRGWISRADGRSHLVAVPEADRDWWSTTSVLVHQDDTFVQESTPTWTCETETSAHGGGGLFLEEEPDVSVPQHQEGGTIECRIAIETDFQFYQLFNDQTAATDYVTSLWGAVSSRYIDAANIFITIPHLSIYTTSSDPWTVPDNNGSSSAMLQQYRNYWQNQGGFPNGAHLAHFMSGASLGGGVAYLNSYCSPSGVAVSGNLHGQTPMPVPPKSFLSWDFVVTAHETGHSAGSPHTHDYCPAIDECYPGFCSSGNNCINNGTIMGYCHLCPGGMNNVQTLFHPRVANTFRQVVQVSCLCSACPCLPPRISLVLPATVAAYEPDGQTVNLGGSRLDEVHTVYVDGVPIPASQFEVMGYDHVQFTMPRVSHTGLVDIVVEDDCGPSINKLVEVVPPTDPKLGVDFAFPPFPLVSISQGLSLIVSAEPDEVVFTFYSADLAPSLLPGYLSLDIGASFSSLFLLWSATVPEKAWESMTFPLTGVTVNTALHLQAAVLQEPGAFPFVETNTVSVHLWP